MFYIHLVNFGENVCFFNDFGFKILTCILAGNVIKYL